MVPAKVDYHRAESPKERIDHRVVFYLRNENTLSETEISNEFGFLFSDTANALRDLQGSANSSNSSIANSLLSSSLALVSSLDLVVISES
uniref:Uncharacterized protein n=1 Tax=Glossina palpalis gambiensis TaxID=67801 RepID=A0A1B0BS14_9MUSC